MAWINLLDVLYPIGSLYFSNNSTSPASVVGGSWTQISGAAIRGTNDAIAGYEGSDTHTITTSEMPSHTHSTSSAGAHTHGTGSSTYNRWAVANANLSGLTGANPAGSGYDFAAISESATWSERTATNSAGAHTHTVNASGGGAAMSLVQRSYNCFIWYRTA